MLEDPTPWKTYMFLNKKILSNHPSVPKKERKVI